MGFLVKIKNKEINEIEVFLDIAIDHILEGNIISFPTESEYKLGCDPTNLNAVERLYRLKFRDRSKGFPLLVSDFEEAKKIAEFNAGALKLASHFWPGQLILKLRKKQPNIIPNEVSASEETIKLNVPENKIISEILKTLKEKGTFGGIIGTSANYSGEDPATSGQEVSNTFLGPIDLILDAGESESKEASTIVDCTKDQIEIMKEGKIRKEEILNLISD
ncbi:MAG: Threonylcarbamoyl-AMP synthase [Promethearchaeota archaeon]|jgi:L-threonylcarbamoyladenylate synthase|nr:MAG: Threonylcarbamoyl-AMP synthase [Candidatus Lokiarchaeota archaeon]